MNTSNFPDVNVRIALMWRTHVHSEKARIWFEEVVEQRIYFCRVTQISVLRILTTERALGQDAQTMAGAWKLWDRMTADDRIAYLPEPEGLEGAFRATSAMASPSPKVWADAYLLGFATAAGLKVVTFDRALRGRGPNVLIL
jgi:toxin-antitoxin system PIN domain toxin